MAAEEEQHDIDHAVARRLFKEYVSAKKAVGQSTKGLSYGKMLAKLTTQANLLKQKLGDVDVHFEVKTIDGKVRLRAVRAKKNGKAKAKAPPPPVAPPSAKSPSARAKPPPVAPPVVAPPHHGDDDAELETEIDHDDLEDSGPEASPEPAPEESIRATLDALREEEDEPLPVRAGSASGDMTASQKLSFATLGDIAKRMDELAERKAAPEKAAKAEHDQRVLEGESSGEADIRAVAASIKKKMEIDEEVGAPAGEIEGDSIPIAIGDEDAEAPVAGGFGAPAAVALVEHEELAPAPADETSPATVEPPAREKAGFPFGLFLAAIVVGGLGIGYFMYGDQLLGGSNATPLASSERGASSQPPHAPEPIEPIEPSQPSEPASDGPTAGPGPTEDTGSDDDALAMEDGEDAGEEAVERGSGADPKAHKPKTPKPSPGDPDGPSDGLEAPTGDESPEGADPPPDSEPPPPEPVKDEPAEVDCLLDPNAPGCKKVEKVVEKEDEGPALPEKLSQNQLRDGFQKVKADAKLCGKQYGAESGTKVSVKVSIEGKTGGITKSSPQGEFASTALGKCVAEALERATFPSFSKPVMGVTWSIRM